METFNMIVLVLFIVVVMVILILNSYNNPSSINENFTFDKNKDIVHPTDTLLDRNASFRDGLERMVYPDQQDTFEYGNYVCTPKSTINSKNQEINQEINQDLESELSGSPVRDINGNTCQNKSLNDKFKTGSIPYKDKACGQLSSNMDGNTIIGGIDPAEFYRDKYLAYPVSMGDDKYYGFNYNNFGDNGSPADIGNIPLYKTNNFPVGVNYKFNS